MLWGLPSAGTEKFVEGNMDRAKIEPNYNLAVNLSQSGRKNEIGVEVRLQPNNDPKHPVKATLGLFTTKNINVFEWARS